MGMGSSLDRRLHSLFKRGVLDGNLNVLGALQFNGNLRIAYTSVIGTALYINKAANTGPTIKAHCHQLAASSTGVTGQVVANEFKGEFLDTIGTMDGIASHFRLNHDSAGIMRAILGVAYLDSGKTLSGTDFTTGSWMVGGLFVSNVSGILSGTGVCVVGLYGGISSCVGSTLTTCKYLASIWADSSRLVTLSTGKSALILATNQTGAATVQFGLYMPKGAFVEHAIQIGDKASAIGSGFPINAAPSDSSGIAGIVRIFGDDGGVVPGNSVDINAVESRFLVATDLSASGCSIKAMRGHLRVVGGKLPSGSNAGLIGYLEMSDTSVISTLQSAAVMAMIDIAATSGASNNVASAFCACSNGLSLTTARSTVLHVPASGSFDSLLDITGTTGAVSTTYGSITANIALVVRINNTAYKIRVYDNS